MVLPGRKGALVEFPAEGLEVAGDALEGLALAAGPGKRGGGEDEPSEASAGSSSGSSLDSSAFSIWIRCSSRRRCSSVSWRVRNSWRKRGRIPVALGQGKEGLEPLFQRLVFRAQVREGVEERVGRTEFLFPDRDLLAAGRGLADGGGSIAFAAGVLRGDFGEGPDRSSSRAPCLRHLVLPLREGARAEEGGELVLEQASRCVLSRRSARRWRAVSRSGTPRD